MDGGRSEAPCLNRGRPRPPPTEDGNRGGRQESGQPHRRTESTEIIRIQLGRFAPGELSDPGRSAWKRGVRSQKVTWTLARPACTHASNRARRDHA
eukprot:3607688-Pyramimonas_sp.AAC.1